MGGGGVQEEWMSTFQDLPKYNCYQNLTHLKNQSAMLLAFMGGQSSVNMVKQQIKCLEITFVNSIRFKCQIKLKLKNLSRNYVQHKKLYAAPKNIIGKRGGG